MTRPALAFSACALAASCACSETGIEGGADARTDAAHDTVVDPAEDVSVEPSGPCDDYVGQASREEIAQTPREDLDAELLALGLTGGLTADPDVYERIRSDLAAIREMDPTIAHIRVFGPDGKGVTLYFDGSTIGSVRAGTYTAWDCPNEFYELEMMSVSESWSHASLTFEGIYNMGLIADEYAELPGVTDVEWGIWAGDGPTICLTAEGEVHHYVFDDAGGDCPAGCTEHRFVYFLSRPGMDPAFMGSWDSRTGEERPPWVDLYGWC